MDHEQYIEYTEPTLEEQYTLNSWRQLKELSGLTEDEIKGKKIFYIGQKNNFLDTAGARQIECKVGELPDLSEINDDEADIIYFALTLSKPTLIKMEDDEEEELAKQIERKLKTGGYAISTPMNQDLGDDGRTYDPHFITTLGKLCTYNGGNLQINIDRPLNQYVERLKINKVDRLATPQDLEKVCHYLMGDAMTLAYADDRSHYPFSSFRNATDASDKTIDTWLRKTTYSECVHNSIKVINFICAHDPESLYFDRKILLVSHIQSSEDHNAVNRDNTWDKHAAFLYPGNPAQSYRCERSEAVRG